ncbi:MAG: hypothetical protein RLZZ165_2211 [Bacteroidota bacterium]|jgi:hypothetical protein
MKRFITFIFLLVLAVGFAAAQVTANSGQQGKSSILAPGSWIPDAWRAWLENGGRGAMPGDLRDAILNQAASWGKRLGLSPAQMRQKYEEGLLTIQLVSVGSSARATTALIFRVSYLVGGGSEINVVIDES